MKNFVLIAIASLGLGLAVGCSDVSFKAKEKKSGGGKDGGNDPGGCTSNCGGGTPSPTTQSFSIPAANNKVDILFVVDNSRSMETEQANLGSRFNNFISSLSLLDWQIGFVTTDMNGTGPTQDGNLLYISGTGSKILKSTDSSPDTKFKNTVQRPEIGYGDERGIYAAIKAMDRNESGLVRSGSDLAVVVLSDEDERSQAGGLEGYPMEHGKDYASDLISKIKSKYGNGKKFAIHSIIVRPGDETCRLAQDAQQGVSAHFGTVYAEASNSTGGAIGTVCSSNWGAQLSNIGNVIVEMRDSITLKCVPTSAGVEFISTTPSNLLANQDPGYPYTNGNKVFFRPGLPPGSALTARFTCQ